MYEIAQKTLEQLGGAGRLVSMIGASKFSYNQQGSLTFHFKGCQKANIVYIKLNNLDTYDIRFYKQKNRGMLSNTIEINGVYAEDLKKEFEDYTGLLLTF